MNSTRDIVLQPDGTIVVSGKSISSHADLPHADIARHDSNDELDASFGSGSKLTLVGVDVGQGLARQPDGKFILVSSATSTAAARINPRCIPEAAAPCRVLCHGFMRGKGVSLGRPRAVI